MKILDYYSFRARTIPVIIVLIPILILYSTIITDNFNVVKLEYSIGYIFVITISFFLSQIGREYGKKKEKYLFSLWGGTPTTIFFRYNTNLIEKDTRNRYFRKLESLIPGMKMPSEIDEKENPIDADEKFISCTKYLLSQTRDKEKYQLLFSENVNYGFRRNLWGMKPFAIIISLIVLFIQIYILFNDNQYLIFYKKYYFPILINIIILFIWIFIIKQSWVRTTAFAYAKQLLESIDSL